MTCFCQEAVVASYETALYTFEKSATVWRQSEKSTPPTAEYHSWMVLTSHCETPMDTIISPGSAILGSRSTLDRKHFMVSRNLFLPSANNRSS